MQGTVSMNDRRGHQRTSVSLPAQVFDDTRLVVQGRTLDVSMGGALLHGRARLSVGQAVRVEVPRGRTRNPLVLRAEVVRLEEPSAGQRRHGLALRWLEPSLVDVAALASLLRDRTEPA